MSKPPDRAIRELVNDLYRRLDIASRPRCAEAKLLEQIGLAADALQAGTDDPRVAALEARIERLRAYGADLADRLAEWDRGNTTESDQAAAQHLQPGDRTD